MSKEVDWKKEYSRLEKQLGDLKAMSGEFHAVTPQMIASLAEAAIIIGQNVCCLALEMEQLKSAVKLALAFADRVAAQSELLSKKAEKPNLPFGADGWEF